MKNYSASTVIIGVLCTAIIGLSGYSAYKYLSVDKDMLGKKEDAVNDTTHYGSTSVNTEIVRSQDWKHIASQAIISSEEFAGIDGSTATIPITAELARQFWDVQDNNLKYYVSHNKTDEAYENLILKEKNKIWGASGWRKETVHLVFATPPSQDEYDLAESNGVTLEVEPIALDGFVFITHKDNPVDSLTVEQVQDIYTGKITNWKKVGGNDEKIRAFQRTKNSGSQTAMEEMVMQGKPMKEAPIAFVEKEMGGLVEAVAEYENESPAIGYTYYYYINNLYKNEDIKVLNIDGISPENENLINGSYPFTASYYAVIRSDEPQYSVYRQLRDYMLTDEGQQIVEMAGYCPVSPTKQ